MNIDKSKNYRRDIDGLRAIAVLSVVCFHAFPKYLPGGFVGVDIFFVISGFLISSIILTQAASDTFSLTQFYQKRIRRIFPALLTVITFCMILGYFVLYDNEYQALAKHLTGSTGFVSNFILWKEANYFDISSELKPLLHLWSLSIEEQFYIVWPCILLVAFKRKWSIYKTIIILFVASMTLNLLKVGHHQTATFYFPVTRAWELLLGAALAQHTLHANVKPSKLTEELLASAGIIFIALAITLFNNHMLFPGLWALLPTLGAAFLMSSPNARINQYLLAHPICVGIGLISYPLYLWHWPLLSFAHITQGSNLTTTLTCALVLLSVGLAYLTYRLIEHPLRFAMQPSTAVKTLVFGLLFIGSASLYLYGNTPYLPGRAFAKAEKQTLTALSSFYAYQSAAEPCGLKTPGTELLSLCYKAKPGEPTHVLWGDSHAEHLFPGIIDKDTSRNWILLGHSACPPILNTKIHEKGREEVCSARNQVILQAIIDTPSIEAVTLAFLGPFYISDTGYAKEHIGEHGPKRWVVESKTSPRLSRVEAFYEGLEQTVRELEAHGKKVFLYRDVPEVPFIPSQCLNRPLGPQKFSCYTSADIVINERQATYMQVLRKLELKYTSAQLFDSTPYLCDNGLCHAQHDNKFIYRDGHHLSAYGSRLLAAPFLAWLQLIEENLV